MLKAEEIIQKAKYQEPRYKVKRTVGFVPVIGDVYAHQPTAKSLALKLQVVTRSVPKPVVEKKLAEILETTPDLDKKRAVSDIHDELLQVAFPTTKQHLIWYDAQSEMLYVEASSRKAAETLTEELRKVVGTLELEPMPVITEWLGSALFLGKGYLYNGFVLGEDAELVGKDKNKVTFTHEDLTDEDLIYPHKLDSKHVTKLGLVYQDRTSFVLTDDCCIKKLKTQFDLTLDGEPEDVDASLVLLLAEVNELMAVLPKGE